MSVGEPEKWSTAAPVVRSVALRSNAGDAATIPLPLGVAVEIETAVGSETSPGPKVTVAEPSALVAEPPAVGEITDDPGGGERPLAEFVVGSGAGCGAPATYEPAPGTAAVIVCAAASTVEGSGVAVPDAPRE